MGTASTPIFRNIDDNDVSSSRNSNNNVKDVMIEETINKDKNNDYNKNKNVMIEEAIDKDENDDYNKDDDDLPAPQHAINLFMDSSKIVHSATSNNTLPSKSSSSSSFSALTTKLKLYGLYKRITSGKSYNDDDLSKSSSSGEKKFSSTAIFSKSSKITDKKKDTINKLIERKKMNRGKDTIL